MCEPYPGPPCTAAAARLLKQAETATAEARDALSRCPDDVERQAVLRDAVAEEAHRRLVWESTPGGQKQLAAGFESARDVNSAALDECRDRIAAGRLLRMQQRRALLEVSGEDEETVDASLRLMLSRAKHARSLVQDRAQTVEETVGFFLECHPETSHWITPREDVADALDELLSAGPPAESGYVAMARRDARRDLVLVGWWRRFTSAQAARHAAEEFQIDTFWDAQLDLDIRRRSLYDPVPDTPTRSMHRAVQEIQVYAAARTATAAMQLAHWRRQLAARYSA